ncbi:MAG: CBS domain-containing protein [Planctomycetota bacterium]
MIQHEPLENTSVDEVSTFHLPTRCQALKQKASFVMETAKDVMRTGVVTIGANATLSEAARTLLEHKISGLPVTDNSNFLLGVISEFALLTISYNAFSSKQLVQDHMTTHVISVSPDASLKELADTFILHRIRRLPVTENGRLLGMLSRRDLLRAALDAGQPICETDAVGT